MISQLNDITKNALNKAKSKKKTVVVFEDSIRETMPEILDILLLDRTKSTKNKDRNIIWANDNYIKYSSNLYSAKREILPSLITGHLRYIVKPRAKKDIDVKKKRTKANAEVFTPIWVVEKQIDEIIDSFKTDDLFSFINRTWLEITAGEAPYITSRYDVETGELLEIQKRVGFLDRKLMRINNSINNKKDWQNYVKMAYKSSYGFEWNGDSILIARENLLLSYRDYYINKWNEEPSYEWFYDIAIIISYNIFQMDGINYTVPLSERREKIVNNQLSLFEDNLEPVYVDKPGIRVKIMNWESSKMEYFDKEVIR